MLEAGGLQGVDHASDAPVRGLRPVRHDAGAAVRCRFTARYCPQFVHADGAARDVDRA